MSETVKQEKTDPTGGTSPEKTFTQSQLDAIVADRLKREREKYPDYDDLKAKAARLDELEEANRSELEKAQASAADYKAKLEALQQQQKANDARMKISAEKGVPVHLLTGQTEEECKQQAEKLLQWHAGRQKYPDTGDGGAPQGGGAGGSARDSFAQWAAEML